MYYKGMKFKILLLLSSALLSCSLIPKDTYYPTEWNIPSLGLNTPQKVMSWVAKNIKYKTDVKEYWQDPQETYNLRTGDCEDYVILVLYLLKRDLGISAQLVLGREAGTALGHAWLFWDGKDWESEWGIRMYYSTDGSFYDLHFLSYEEVLQRVARFHGYLR